MKQLNDSVPQPISAPNADPKPVDPILYSNNLRPLALAPIQVQGQKPKESQKVPQKALVARIEELFMKKAINSYPMKVLKAIRDKVSNNSFVTASPDAATRSVFAQSQMIIWAVEGN